MAVQDWDHTVKTVQNEVQQAVEDGNRAMALGGVMAFVDVQETFGATKQAEFLLRLAESRGHDLAARLCRIHLSAKSALSGDNNFLCQAAWTMAGGVSPVAEKILPVTTAECSELLDRARERWKNPHPIPKWCCDGIHCAGDDPRFTGMLPEMWDVCLAFQHYGRVDPSDEWLPQFRCYDGLVIEGDDGAAEGSDLCITLLILLPFIDGRGPLTTPYGDLDGQHMNLMLHSGGIPMSFECGTRDPSMIYLEPSEVLSVLKAAKAKSARSFAMVLLAYKHGLRASEVCNLRIG